MVPHAAKEERYKQILAGNFVVALRGLEALQYDLDEDEDRPAASNPVEDLVDGAELQDADDGPFDENDFIAALEESLFRQDAVHEADDAVSDASESPAPSPPGPPRGGDGGDASLPPGPPPALPRPEAPGVPSPPSVGGAVVSADVAGAAMTAALKRGRWGVFSIIPKQPKPRMPHGGWQARCVFHRLS